jgi:hypothetical protein
MLNGWTTRTAQELDATIRTWAEVFSKKRIPIEHYPELYRRAFDTRQKAMRSGEYNQVPAIDAALLVSHWTGEHGLYAELEQKRIDERRYLPDTAASDCPKCFGSGMECVPGKGARVCKH